MIMTVDVIFTSVLSPRLDDSQVASSRQKSCGLSANPDYLFFNSPLPTYFFLFSFCDTTRRTMDDDIYALRSECEHSLTTDMIICHSRI